MKENVDMHVHTHYSDGEHSNEFVIRRALERELKAIAITNHDTVAGLAEAVAIGKQLGLEVIPGIEVTTIHSEGVEPHILGYFPSGNGFDALESSFIPHIRGRNERVARILKKVNESGHSIGASELWEAARPSPYLSNMHLGKILVQRGLYDSALAFANETKQGGKYYEKYNEVYFMKPHEAVEFLKGIGAKVVLAHPVKLKGIDQKQFILGLRNHGLDGIEAINGRTNPEYVAEMAGFAQKNRLMITAGSDYHGQLFKPGVELGTVGSYELVEQLRGGNNV